MDELSPEKIAHIKNLLKEMDFNPSNQSLIQDNKIIFTVKNNCYRCIMPSQRIQSEAFSLQNKFKIALLSDSGNITRKKLIKVLKESQDIDIEELTIKKDKLKEKLQDTYLDLAPLLDDEEEKITELTEKKKQIEADFMSISIEIVEHLSPCIEEQIKMQYYKFLSYACTEKLVASDVSGQDKWVSVWKSFEEYENDISSLTYMAVDNIQSLLLNIRD